MKTEEAKIVELTEQIVILYANHSGRESDNRGQFRKEVEEKLTQALATYKASILSECEKCVPEQELLPTQCSDTTFAFGRGHNSCRTQTLQAINSLKV